MPFNSHEINTVIVGAGPVGLLNAVGILKKNPSQKVILLEKYRSYQRHHVLQMHYRPLENFIRNVGDDPTLNHLLKQLKKSKYIRTSDIESQLKKRALELGAEVRTNYEVKNVQKDVYEEYPNAQLIIGADGTHSILSDQVFGVENKQKFPFDFVLQLRYEIDGDVKKIELPDLVQFMQSYGITCDEYVGKKGSNDKTPVTFQLMITKEQFDQLYPIATSKNPIRPFSKEAVNADKVPSVLIKRLKGYLGLRLRHFTQARQIIDLNSATISVNEAPATRAANVYKHDAENSRDIILIGDAALGLSYFKGLNAGIETTAKLLPNLVERDTKRRQSDLNKYNQWFDEIYAPGKIKEVENFSKFRIRMIVIIFRFLNKLLGSNFLVRHQEAELSVDLYLGYLAEQGTNTPASVWKGYPHREFKYGAFSFTPQTIKTIYLEALKTSVDSFKFYKSTYYFLRDLLLPLKMAQQLLYGSLLITLALPVAFVRAIVGVNLTNADKTKLQTVHDVFLVALRNIGEGVSRVLYACNLALLSSALPLRLIIRGIHSFFSPKRIVENNHGMKQLIEHTMNPTSSVEKKHALTVDLHRKFQKSISRGQQTEINVQEEVALYEKCSPHQPEAYQNYFRLFKSPNYFETCSDSEDLNFRPRF